MTDQKFTIHVKGETVTTREVEAPDLMTAQAMAVYLVADEMDNARTEWAWMGFAEEDCE